MSAAPIDLVLARLEPFRLRQHGQDRWRACCPAHGGKNPSALSVGVGADGAVLLRCWHGCDVDAVAHGLGLELSDLFPPKPEAGAGAGPLKRRRLLTAGQALQLLADESNVAAVAAANLANGGPFTDADRERLLQAAGRIAWLREEVMA